MVPLGYKLHVTKFSSKDLPEKSYERKKVVVVFGCFCGCFWHPPRKEYSWEVKIFRVIKISKIASYLWFTMFHDKKNKKYKKNSLQKWKYLQT